MPLSRNRSRVTRSPGGKISRTANRQLVARTNARSVLKGAESRGLTSGRHAAIGRVQRSTIEEHPARQSIDDLCDAREADIEHQIEEEKLSLQKSAEALSKQVENSTKQRVESEAEVAKLDKRIEGMPEDWSPGWGVYGFVLLLLACAEFPTVFSGLQDVPLGPPFMNLLLALVLSAILSVAAHYLAKTLGRLVEEGKQRKERPLEFKIQVALTATFVVGVFLLIIALGLTRGFAFGEIASDSDRFNYPIVIAILLLVLQLLLFTIALVVGFFHNEGHKTRILEKDRSKAAKEAERSRRSATELEAELARTEAEVAGIEPQHEALREQERKLRDIAFKEYDQAYADAAASNWFRYGVRRFRYFVKWHRGLTILAALIVIGITAVLILLLGGGSE